MVAVYTIFAQEAILRMCVLVLVCQLITLYHVSESPFATDKSQAMETYCLLVLSFFTSVQLLPPETREIRGVQWAIILSLSSVLCIGALHFIVQPLVKLCCRSEQKYESGREQEQSDLTRNNSLLVSLLEEDEERAAVARLNALGDDNASVENRSVELFPSASMRTTGGFSQREDAARRSLWTSDPLQ